MDDDEKRAIALWRLGVLGPLMSARLEHGDRRAYFDEAAARTHQQPSGRLVHVSARTVEAWFYAYRLGGFDALMPRTRSDRHTSRAIRPEVADILVRAKREKPRRSIRRIIRMLERAGVVRCRELSRSSVHRLLRARGASARPVRGPSAERRSFLHEHASDLWIGDAMHGPQVVAAGGELRKAYLLSQIDCATRFIVHSYFAVSEGAVEEEHGLKQALLKHGVPRAYYVDRGPAYVAHSLRLICGELGIRLLHTDRQDCEAKGRSSDGTAPGARRSATSCPTIRSRSAIVDGDGDDGCAGVDLDAAVLAALAKAPLSRTALRAAVRVRNERLGQTLAQLARAGRVVRDGDRWARADLPVPVPTLAQERERNGLPLPP